MRHRKKLIALGITVLLCCLLISGYWVWASRGLTAEVARWSEKRRVEGFVIEYGGPEVGGFPLTLTTQITDPAVARPDGWLWEGPTLDGETPLWAPNRLRLTFPGLHRLSHPESGPSATVEAQADAAEAEARVQVDGEPESFRARITGLTLANEVSGSLAVALLSADYGPPGLGYDGKVKIPLQAEVSELLLPEALDRPFGRQVEQSSLLAELNRPPPWQWTPEALEVWRKSGGKMEVERFNIVWGSLQLEATGTITVDRELRPLGAFDARVVGLQESLDALAAAGAIPQDQVFALQLLLLALSSETDAQGRKVLEVPLSFQQGRLFLGPIPLAELDPVVRKMN